MFLGNFRKRVLESVPCVKQRGKKSDRDTCWVYVGFYESESF